MEKRVKKQKKKKDKAHPKIKQREVITQRIDDLESRYDQIDASQIQLFSDFPLSMETLKGLKEMNYEKPTKIQKESLGRFVLIILNFSSVIFQEIGVMGKKIELM